VDARAVKTYRYLRSSMVLLVVALAASVVVEWWQAGHDCFQTSISAYYYTPAQAVFVGTLIAIGVCMVVLKGKPESEDTLLNIAGMLAPLVALVPTPYEENCFSVRLDDTEMRANVANNVSALIVVGAAGFAVTLWLWLRSARERRHLVGLLVSGAVLVVGTIVFCAAREFFLERAHYIAAVGMFAMIVWVAFLNARGSAEVGRQGYRKVYLSVSVLMAVSIVVGVLLGLAGVAHAVLITEILLIALFVAFWVTQTRDLWHFGDRAELERAAERGEA